MKTEVKSIRRAWRWKQYIPLLFGILAGCFISTLYMPPHMDLCHSGTNEKQTQEKKHLKPKYMNGKDPPATPAPVHVKPKSTRFNYDFRPYFVYSELGFRFQFVISVMTTEERLSTHAVAINNTWSLGMPRVVYFTAYSKNMHFHEHYNTRLNLNVVQLSDITEESTRSEFSFRVLQYMKDHYIDSYSWFMLVSDETYIRTPDMLNFLHSLNSSQDLYFGHPMKRSADTIFEKDTQSPQYYCYDQSGIVLSRSALLKFEVPSVKTHALVGVAIGQAIYKTAKIECVADKELQDLFLVDKQQPITAESVEYNNKAKKALSLYPVHSAQDMLEIHRKFTRDRLHDTIDSIQKHQDNIKALIPKIPEETPEKELSWPIGFPRPFKPLSRFEVIKWVYFDEKKMYGLTDIEPASDYDNVNKEDITNIVEVAQKALKASKPYKLVNGYRRLDPQRGAEYLVDLVENKSGDTKRVYLVKPFTKVEALQMPAATEQKGIHLILPVLREDIEAYERFLQMYKRVCLQTGENVVLLTVFINIHTQQFDDDDDPFIEPKSLIARYKHSYMWAQLPWLQVGVKNYSPSLIMDIVSMKLPSNALLFFVGLNVDFTINFLNRCRVNVVNGIQVFFPIPFAEYDPLIVYKTKQRPTFVDIHRNNGYWHRTTRNVACFNNKDYKDVRMSTNDFLDENQSANTTLLDIFRTSRLAIFRAVEAELRRHYTPMQCDKTQNRTQYFVCTKDAGERTGSRAQLAQIIFQKERESNSAQ